MPKLIFAVFVAAAAAIAAGASGARDAALVLMNTDYSNHPNPGGRQAFGSAQSVLSEAGYQVIALRNLRANRLNAVAEAAKTLRSGERLVVFVAGHIVTGSSGSWLLTSDARWADEFTVGQVGVSIDALLDVAFEAPGEALVLIAPDRRSLALRSELVEDYVPRPIPQGVTVLTGPRDDLAALLQDGFLMEGRTVGAVLDAAPSSVAALGFVARGLAFTPVEPEAPALGTAPSAEEQAFWASMVRINSQLAYQSYLERYPQGAFRTEAEARLSELSLSPEAMAAAEEEGLGLSRNARRDIQRDLSLLGYDTRGIDGIFGRGTRTAIRGWQSDNGSEATGYLTGNQITRIAAAAERRAAELEEEARRRQEERDQQDMAYWRELGRGRDEASLRAYLDRFSDGLFSDIATQRLQTIEDERAAAAAAQDRALWEEVEAIDSVQAYEQYLQRQPDGAFVEQARARMRELTTGVSEQMLAEARAEEARVLSNPITRLIAERRLRQIGLNPGAADGRFDEDTRRAIRRFQTARELPVTGYLTQATLIRLLASN